MALGCLAESLLVTISTSQAHAGLIALPFGAPIGVLARPPVRAWQRTAGRLGPLLGWATVLVLLPAEVLAQIRPVRILVFTVMLLALGNLPGARLRAWFRARLAPKAVPAY